MNLKFWKQADPAPQPGEQGWEQSLVDRVVMESLREQRRSRRWGIFFKLLGFAYLIALLALFWPDDFEGTVTPAEEHTAVVDVKGIIAPGTRAGADEVLTALEKAYEDDKTKGIVLRINSPGGSPVQAGYINDEIRRLREEHKDIPVYAVVADLCASGGYFIAVAADKIYVNEASLVGSIGVRIDSFGFEEAMKELGVERRLLTAGDNKGILDPFSPLLQEQKVFLQSMLDQVHRQFIDVVKEGRGDRLKGGDQVFSGLIWTGEESLKLGLADAIGSTAYVAREVVGAAKTVEFTAEKDLLERLADRLGAAFARTLLEFAGSGYPAVM
jgi:protease-4